MSYTKLTDFAAKDALLSGNPSKVIRGTEIDAEFSSLQTESALLAPKTGIGATGTWGISITGNADTATNAMNVAGTIASAVTATTQTPGDNSTKVATTAYADAATASTTLTTLGGTTVGQAVFTAVDANAAQTAIGIQSPVFFSGTHAAQVSFGVLSGLQYPTPTIYSNVGGGLATDGQFTAPVAGVYRFEFFAYISFPAFGGTRGIGSVSATVEIRTSLGGAHKAVARVDNWETAPVAQSVSLTSVLALPAGGWVRAHIVPGTYPESSNIAYNTGAKFAEFSGQRLGPLP